jgi:hypothetical protein
MARERMASGRIVAITRDGEPSTVNDGVVT